MIELKKRLKGGKLSKVLWGVFSAVLLISSSNLSFGAAEVSVSGLGFSFGGSETKYAGGLGFQQEFLSWFQLGAAAEYEKLSHVNSSLSVWNFRAGPTLNMDGAIPQAYFFSLGFAVRHGTGSQSLQDTDPNGSGGYVQFGKRFPLGTVSFRPNVSLLAVGGLLNFRMELLSFCTFF